MDVGRGHHLFQVLVLEVRETLGDPPGVVIVDERDNLIAALSSRSITSSISRRTHQAPDRLAPIR